MEFEALKLYIRNHDVPTYFALFIMLPFLLLKLNWQGLPFSNPSKFVLIVLLYMTLIVIGFMMLLMQKEMFKNILSIKEPPQKKIYYAIIAQLSAVKTVYMCCWLAFLFHPFTAPLLPHHSIAYGFVFCAIALYSSISAACTLLFFIDLFIPVVFTMIVCALNWHIPQVQYIAGIIALLTVYVALIGRQIKQTTNDVLRAQRNLQKSVENADRANKAKSEFLAMMSHEIRTPMTGVLSMVDFLRETPLRHDQQNSLDTISECSKTLLNTLNDVLDISRIEAGKLSIDPTNFDFHGVLMNSCRILKPTADKKRITLTLIIEDSVPKYMCGDSNRLQQILLNLVNNAIKFTDKGGVMITSSFLNEAILRITVKDTGIGIKEENIKRLFHNFSQADGSITRKYGGSGLGLSIAKKLVGMMGGKIGVASKSGEGSVFWVEIPFKPPMAEKISSGNLSTFPRLPSQHILLVEDNQINQGIVSRILSKHEHIISIAIDGETALEMLAKSPYDIILMDCSLPGMSGIETTRKIQQMGKDYADIPIIALSANVMEENIKKCREAGMRDFVAKPFSSMQLLDALSKHIRNASSKPVILEETCKVSLSDSDDDAMTSSMSRRLELICEEFGSEYAAHLIEKSQIEMDRLLEIIRYAIRDERYVVVKKSTHELRSIAGYIGMEKTQLCAEELEVACDQRDFLRLPQLYQSLITSKRNENPRQVCDTQ